MRIGGYWENRTPSHEDTKNCKKLCGLVPFCAIFRFLVTQMYRVHRDLCGLCIGDTLSSGYGAAMNGVETMLDAIGLTIDIVDTATSADNPWIDTRYPVVQNGYERYK